MRLWTGSIYCYSKHDAIREKGKVVGIILLYNSRAHTNRKHNWDKRPQITAGQTAKFRNGESFGWKWEENWSSVVVYFSLVPFCDYFATSRSVGLIVCRVASARKWDPLMCGWEQKDETALYGLKGFREATATEEKPNINYLKPPGQQEIHWPCTLIFSSRPTMAFSCCLLPTRERSMTWR